ncbi:hypothetical protein Patl1_18251 [Pistacia atlantica]|uniref:Uncharacterized protein n=1 Tax=Pistacia atlantica TaxID=434234 RepID=A0ACC1BXZ7_9ROSI|nr:hypothetical protein Patl1_18251 [Pistacia atlantica]
MTEEYETYRRMDKKFQEAYHCCLDNKNKLEHPNKRLEDLKAELLNWHDGMNVQEQNSGDVVARQLDDDNRGRNTTPRINKHVEAKKVGAEQEVREGEDEDEVDQQTTPVQLFQVRLNSRVQVMSMRLSTKMYVTLI